MAAADVKDGGATVFRTDVMVVTVRGRMSKVSFSHEMKGALEDLRRTGHHSQDQDQGTDFGATDTHNS